MIITMNQRELHHLVTLNKVLDNHLSKVDTAQLLNLSIRLLYRLISGLFQTVCVRHYKRTLH